MAPWRDGLYFIFLGPPSLKFLDPLLLIHTWWWPWRINTWTRWLPLSILQNKILHLLPTHASDENDFDVNNVQRPVHTWDFFNFLADFFFTENSQRGRNLWFDIYSLPLDGCFSSLEQDVLHKIILRTLCGGGGQPTRGKECRSKWGGR